MTYSQMLSMHSTELGLQQTVHESAYPIDANTIIVKAGKKVYGIWDAFQSSDFHNTYIHILRARGRSEQEAEEVINLLKRTIIHIECRMGLSAKMNNIYSLPCMERAIYNILPDLRQTRRCKKAVPVLQDYLKFLKVCYNFNGQLLTPSRIAA